MTSSLVPSLIAFLGVIALIPVALWVMKRAQSLRPGAGGPLAIVAALSTGPRERIAVLNAGGRYLVVGITAQQMTLLATLDEWPGAGAPDASASTPAPSPFSRLLRRIDPNDPNR
jgi:flagellar protein FliO/FliZ